ncbi:hypothetical protein ABFS82_05G135600 [Erythranthe guttata]
MIKKLNKKQWLFVFRIETRSPSIYLFILFSCSICNLKSIQVVKYIITTYVFFFLLLFYKQCCFPPNLVGHKCKQRYAHAEYGTAITWDDAVQSSTRHFEHKSYNLFTCNCHSFVANCLNRLCYEGSMNWNMVNVAALILFKGNWVDAFSVLRSFLPFFVMICFGVFMVGWPFLIGLFSFSFMLVGWFLMGTYVFTNVLEC